MKRLQVDFSAARRASPWVGRVMLAVAAVISLDAALSYQSLHQATREGEKQLARRAPGLAMTKATPQEVAAVRETSVLIAALLAAPLARERVGPARIAGAALVVAGVASIALG